MNPDLTKLQPYPFEKLAQLKAGVSPPANLAHISLSIGEPQHTTPSFITEEIITHLHGLATYPLTRGEKFLRQTIADWLSSRFQLPSSSIDVDRHILPVNGTREALFAFAQAVIDRSRPEPVVVMPNPFYQIYEGAALLAGAQPWYLNTTSATNFLPDFSSVPDTVWQRCQLVYVCSPGNPTGSVIPARTWHQLIALADEYDFIIAADECYSEIYLDEQQPPLGLLQVAAAMGRTDYKRCVVFHSLSKRSNVPGLRSGFVAGDADVMQKFLHYRTYHGCAMPPPTQYASQKAWADERHVISNRELYRAKFKTVLPIINQVLRAEEPQGGFYLWAQTPIDDAEFARELFRHHNVTVLPGSYLSRAAHGINPGQNYVRIALVPPIADCVEAAEHIVRLAEHLSSTNN